MKRLFFILFVFIVVAAAIAGWMVFGSSTGFTGSQKVLYIPSTAATKEAVMDSIRRNHLVISEKAFDALASRMKYWDHIRPGRYEIPKGSSLISIVRKLRNGNQDALDLVIIKLRTKEELARMVGRKFECDSARMMDFLNNADSLKQFETTPEVALWRVMPDKYSFYWNASPQAIYKKFFQASKKFWNSERVKKAAAQGLTPLQADIIASIVEEETNHNEEKDTIASVYINRFRKGMLLQADPTVKFAVKDFSITWVHGAMLDSPSPYNTYKVAGLPPGPICTPSRESIEAVLDAPQTDYLFFAANSAFNGTHVFTADFEQHLKNAAAFQAEDRRRREAKQKETR